MRASRLHLTLSLILTLPLAACSELFGPDGSDTLRGFEEVTVEKQPGNPFAVRPVRIEDVPGRPFGVRAAPNGDLFVTQQDLSQVTIVGSGGTRDVAGVGVDPGDVILSADGSVAIVSTFVSGDLHFIDAATGNETDFTDIGGNAYRLALSANGSTVFVTTTGGQVHAVTVATGNKADSVQLAGSLQGIARRDANTIAVSSTNGAVTLLNAATLDVITSRNVGSGNQDIVFSEDGSRLYVAQEFLGRILELDATTLATVDSVLFRDFEGNVDFAPFGMALGPDGRSLVVTSPLSGGIAVVDARSMRIVRQIVVAGTPRRVTFKPDGSRAYVANEAGYLNVIR